MRVPFLDIDGVLNSSKTAVAFGGYPLELTHIGAFDRVAIRLLHRFCDSARVQVVLSSAWRLHHPFADVGKALGLPIIDATPWLCGQPRGFEIASGCCCTLTSSSTRSSTTTPA
ncbi:HAD domain-containing protein [Mitsuaria sp. GD03876]|uniref:HAD domain-containing protein n=1 Tax=Mitsuaria sp. GD03876 TaxID=2975399 RepID=UPI00244746DD|nr:HAD domain-containing protein [Mitsuaria sp. GD03876]MDH0863237.1 HAD domain-containing protein [Mitsuaria sp. GD03876]